MAAMNLHLFIVGFILLFSGFLTGKYPKLINVLSEEDRRVIDWQKVGRLSRKWLVGAGLCQLLGTILLQVLGIPEIVIVYDIILVMVVWIALIIHFQKLTRRV